MEILALCGVLLMLSAIMLPAIGEPIVFAISMISGMIGYHARGAVRIIVAALLRH